MRETLFRDALHDAQQVFADDPSEENSEWVRALKEEMRERGFYVAPPRLSPPNVDEWEVPAA